MTTADGIAGLLPSLSDARTLSAVDTVNLAASLRGLATEYAQTGTDDIESACGLRRQLHSLAAVLFGRDGLPPDALIDVDTATRLVERAAALAIFSASDEADATRWLGHHGPELVRLHTENGDETVAEAIRICREHGEVSFLSLRAVLDGEQSTIQPREPVPAPEPRSAEEVKRTVRGMITDVRGAASAAESLRVVDVDTLDPAEAADLSRELWDQMVITTRAYAALQRRGQKRRSA